MGVAQAGAQALSAAPAGYGDLGAFFAPASVAVIGASADTGKFGGRALAYLLRGDAGCIVHAVNPRQPRIQGVATVPNLAAIDAPVDLAVIAVPPAACEQAIEDCVAAGVRGAVVFTSGFAESGTAGRQLQDRLLAIARGRTRLLGPNCIGVVDERRRFAATFATMWRDGWPTPGHVSIVSQSGAFASYLYVLLRERGIGIAHWVATGNEIDVDAAEMIVHLVRDPDVRVIAVALEGVANGPALLAALRLARAAHKPVVLLKMGRSEVGAAAVQSHTGAIAGAERVFDAAVGQAGAVRCATVEAAVDAVATLAIAPLPRGRRVGIVSASGGGGILMADRAADLGLEVPALDPSLRATLDAVLPGGSSRNPVDVTAMVLNDLDLMVRPLELVAASPDVDAVAAFLTSAFRMPATMDALIAKLRASSLPRCGKPVLLSLYGAPEALAALHDAGFPAFVDPTRAIDALGVLVRTAARFAAPAVESPGAAQRLDASPARPLDPPARDDEAALIAFADAHGVPGLPTRLLRHAAEVNEHWCDFGGRVAMKIAVSDLAHKSELDGVILDVTSMTDAARAFDTLVARAKAHGLRDRLAGIVMQEQRAGVAEMLLGMHVDPVFGAVVTIGIGGRFVEVLDDVALAIAPIGATEARAMLASLRGFPLLTGARGRPSADVDALVDAVVHFSVLAARLRGVASFEINPFIVGAAGEGGAAADAKLVRRA